MMSYLKVFVVLSMLGLLSIACEKSPAIKVTETGWPDVKGKYSVSESTCSFADALSTFVINQEDSSLSISISGTDSASNEIHPQAGDGDSGLPPGSSVDWAAPLPGPGEKALAKTSFKNAVVDAHGKVTYTVTHGGDVWTCSGTYSGTVMKMECLNTYVLKCGFEVKRVEGD